MAKNYQILILFFAGITVVHGENVGDDDISFTRDVRPILSRRCFACHGPDDDARVSDMRLDKRDGLFDQEISPVVPRDTAASEIYLRITNSDPDIAMPPVDANSQITDKEREVIRRWIEQGAVWENHWSFSPIATPRPSRNHTRPPGVVRGNHPIDAFIRSRQQSRGLRSNLPATPYVLIRRLYLDLIGLPPTIAQADHWRTTAFTQRGTVKPSQFAALVDELINSKQYGERWARRWLDLARYARSPRSCRSPMHRMSSHSRSCRPTSWRRGRRRCRGRLRRFLCRQRSRRHGSRVRSRGSRRCSPR
ncbi:MAG: DUF1549 domain-containing protein [Pirellulaceae bacterium]